MPFTTFCIVATASAFAENLAQVPLLRIVESHVAIAERNRGEEMLWGRLGGSAAERESADVLTLQLSRFVDSFGIEPVSFEAWRPRDWEVRLESGGVLASAMPAPFDAWFPDVGDAPVVRVSTEQDWLRVRECWAFIEATTKGSPASTSIREQDLYRRAVESGATGLIFSIPTPPGDWRAVVPVDKPFTEPDTRYPDHRRPIPAFCVSSDDGSRLREAAAEGETLRSRIRYDERTNREGRNAIGTIDADSDRTVMIACHLDSFFEGANDDASGIAVMVGLAEKLSALTKDHRRVNFVFAGLSAHHDEGAGMRAFMYADAARAAAIECVILLEHLDAHSGDLGVVPEWPENLNDFRAAYIGPKGWQGLEDDIAAMTRESGLMNVGPRIVPECIADLFVVCGQKLTFCLMQAPPFYHTNHDTIDKLTEEGLENAVDFHLRFLLRAGYISRLP